MALLERTATHVYRRWLEGDTPVTREIAKDTARARRVAFAVVAAAYPACAAVSWATVGWRRLTGKPPRILWGPTPILTIAESSQLLNRLGYPSQTLVFTTYHIQRDFDIDLTEPIANPLVGFWLPNALFLWSLLRFDVFHFFYDGGLWSGMNILPSVRWLELPLLRLAGKRVIASAYGGDVRIREINERWQPYNICAECPEPGTHCVCGERGIVRNKYYTDWCNVALAMMDMYDHVIGGNLDFKYWPVDIARIDPGVSRPASDGPVRVVHGTGHRYFKGTRFLLDAVSLLREEGLEIELDLVEGVSNVEAKHRWEAADIVFCHCIGGCLGYTELEAMAAGKPVLGNIRNTAYLRSAPACPVVHTTPQTLVDELRTLVLDPELRGRLGREGRAYVECEWSYEALAPSYDKLHQQVWRHNGLARTVIRKWRDVRDGEMPYRLGPATSGARLAQLPVYPDPALYLRRVEEGMLGQPPFDDRGVPRVFRDGRYVEDPGAVAEVGLAAFHLARQIGPGDEAGRLAVTARWLCDALEVDDRGVGRWHHHFAVAGRELGPVWVSCRSQSLGLSVLLRAQQRFPDDGFGDAARAAGQLFRVPVGVGGVLSDEEGLTRFEGYPEPQPAHVLDHWLSAIFGLHEYALHGGERWTRELLERSIGSVRATLAAYETPAGVRNDLRSEQPVSEAGLYLLIAQLRGLATITGDQSFSARARAWTRQLYAARLRNFLTLRGPL